MSTSLRLGDWLHIFCRLLSLFDMEFCCFCIFTISITFQLGPTTQRFSTLATATEEAAIAMCATSRQQCKKPSRVVASCSKPAHVAKAAHPTTTTLATHGAQSERLDDLVHMPLARSSSALTLTRARLEASCRIARRRRRSRSCSWRPKMFVRARVLTLERRLLSRTTTTTTITTTDGS